MRGQGQSGGGRAERGAVSQGNLSYEKLCVANPFIYESKGEIRWDLHLASKPGQTRLNRERRLSSDMASGSTFSPKFKVSAAHQNVTFMAPPSTG